MSRSAIMNFSGVLGIHPTELCSRKPYDYTPFISALLWVRRLIILEYALPLAPYNHLKTPWPERTIYVDQAQRLREHIRPKYLQRGSLAPAGYLIERLQHGRAIARREGPRTNISWSSDGLTLHVADTQIHMRQLRETVRSAIVRLQSLAQELLFGWCSLCHIRGYWCSRQHAVAHCRVPGPDQVRQTRNVLRRNMTSFWDGGVSSCSGQCEMSINLSHPASDPSLKPERACKIAVLDGLSAFGCCIGLNCDQSVM
jgi:hypothetical protein